MGDRGNVDTASVQEVVLGIQPEELSEGEHIYVVVSDCVVKDGCISEEVMHVAKRHVRGTLRGSSCH